MSGRGNKAGAGGGDDTVIRIPPHYYIHVLDLKTNVTKPIIGPETFVRQVMAILLLNNLNILIPYICYTVKMSIISKIAKLRFRTQLRGFELPGTNQT